VDACTTTAPDAIAAFAVPSPGYFSQQLVFSGLVAQRVTSLNESLGLLRTGQFLLDQPFQLSTSTHYSRFFAKCSDPDHTLQSSHGAIAEQHRRQNPEFGGVGHLGTQSGSGSAHLI
jgi:hypothetical protein